MHPVFIDTSFVIPNAPVLLEPFDNTSGMEINPSVLWEPDENADEYRLVVAEENEFGKIIFNKDGILEPSKTIHGLKENTKYFWKVLSINSGCHSEWSDTWEFATTEASGIETQVIPALEFSIYPNPTNSLLTIETGIADINEIEITTQNGQLIYSSTIVGTTHQLDLSSFDSGVYFITIRSNDFVTTRKIIKL
jgi:hypothetical protein